jgi:hypothetical protein
LEPVLRWLLAYNASKLPGAVRSETQGGTTRIAIGDDISIEGSTLEAVLWLSGREGTDLALHGPSTEIDRVRNQLRV